MCSAMEEKNVFNTFKIREGIFLMFVKDKMKRLFGDRIGDFQIQSTVVCSNWDPLQPPYSHAFAL